MLSDAMAAISILANASSDSKQRISIHAAAVPLLEGLSPLSSLDVFIKAL